MSGPYGPPGPGPGRPYGPGYGPPPYGYRPQAPPLRFSEGTHRLHWGTAPLRMYIIMTIYFVLVGVQLLFQALQDEGLSLSPEATVGLVLLTVVVTVIAAGVAVWPWLAMRFWIGGADLVVETGLLRKRRRMIPLSRIQAVDVVRPLVSRVFRLAEVRVELAGDDRSEIVLRYLGRSPAQQFRAEVLARAAGLPGHTPEAPERPFWRVPAGALLGSLLIKLPVVGTFLLMAALVIFGIAAGEAGVLGGAIPAFLGLIQATVAPLIMYARFTAATSPDGLRLRYGLLETRMQTVPPGRVQAIRLVEPLLWRAIGWARVDVTVAGYTGDRQAVSSVLLPVAPRQVALALVAEVFPGTAVDAIPIHPAKAVSPGTTGAGSDAVVFVTRHGLVCRRTDVIAHARAQSVRLTANPLQRLLGLGTVHVDAPPGPVQVAAAGRDLGEARVIVESTAERARVARATSRDPGHWAR